jgi:tetratricopeptide (TPR) repeat protein
MTHKLTTRWGQRLLLTALLLTSLACSRSPQATRDRHLERGKSLMANKEYARAVLEFRSAAQAMPKEAETYYQLALAARGSEDIATAVQALRKAIDLDPKHTGAQLVLAGLMAASGDRDLLKEAEKRLRTLIETAPVTAEMLNILALTELRMGKTEDAVHNLEQALAKAPQELNSAVILSLAKLAQEDFAGAEEVLKKACENSPKSVEARVILARFYHSRGRRGDAETQIRRALELKPDHSQALMDLGRMQSAAGKKADAEGIFKRLSLSGEKIYRSVYGLFLYQDGRREEAVKEFERLVKLDPEDRMARTRLVAAYGAVNRKADAEKILAVTLAKNPKDLEALVQRAEIYVTDGKYEEAEADLNQVVRLKPDAAEVRYTVGRLQQARGNVHSYRQELAKALELNPYLLPVRLELAQALVANKSARAALDLLAQTPESQRELTPLAVQRNWVLWALSDRDAMRKGIDEALKRERAPALLIQDGMWKLRARDYQGARAALEEALKINPGDIQALAALNETYTAEKKPGIALQRVKELAAAQPKSAPVQDFLGLLLLANGDWRQARSAFTAARKADPAFVRADLSLVQLDAAERKWDDAINKLETIVSSNQRNTMARLWLGNLQVVKGNHQTAIQHFQKVVDSEPGNAQALNNLAYLLSEHANRPDEALKLAQRAVELAPQVAPYNDTLGWILYRKGVFNTAIQHLERAAADKSDVVWKYHLAMAYAKGGQPARGQAILQEALKQDPKRPEAKMAREVLGVPQPN